MQDVLRHLVGEYLGVARDDAVERDSGNIGRIRFGASTPRCMSVSM